MAEIKHDVEAAAPSMPTGSTLDDYQAAKDAGKVVVVSRSTCTFCARTGTVLQDMLPAEQLAIFDIDKTAEGASIRAKAKADSRNHPTVPMVFHGDQFIGGCDSVMAAIESGSFQAMTGCSKKPGASAASVRPKPPVMFPLFHFPHTVNGVAARMVGLQMCSFAIVTIVFREEPWAFWMAFLMTVDRVIHLVGGGTASPVGMFAAVLASPFPEALVAGPQKQFAVFCAVFFSGMITLLLCVEQYAVCIVVAGMLLGAAFLECFFNFCAGCVVFNYMIRFGIIPATVNDLHIGQKALTQNQLNHADRSEELASLTVHVQHQPGQPETPADLRVKAHKRDDHKRQGFHPVKYVQLSDFQMPLAISVLALAWQMGYYTPSLACSGDAAECRLTDNVVWKYILGVSAVIFTALLALLVLKAVIYPHKFMAEIKHPVRSHACASLPMYLVIAALFLFDAPQDSFAKDGDTSRHVALVLFWIGAVLLKLLLVVKVANMVGQRSDSSQAQVFVLFPILACTAAGVVAPVFNGFDGASMYVELGWFFFGMSGLLSLLLTGGTLLQSVTFHWSDERSRPAIGLWVVAFHLPFLAYLMLTQGSSALYDTTVTATGLSSVSLPPMLHMLFFAGLSFLLVLFWLAVPMGFLFRLKFDFSFWALAMPVNFAACAVMVYLKLTHASTLRPGFAHGLAYTGLATATYSTLLLLLNTTFWLCKRRWLRPDYKWAPLSLNKLTHEAFHADGQRMLTAAVALKEKGSLSAAQGLAASWLEYACVLEWHAHQEDNIMFREVDSFNPMVTRDGYLQHVELEKMEGKINAAAETVKQATTWDANAEAACVRMVAEMERYFPYMAKHMDWEEENLLMMNRRTFNLEIQLSIVRKIWQAYEYQSVEEFRASVGEHGHGTITDSQAGGWGQYDLASFRRRGNYVYPEGANMDALLDFPPKFPPGELPLEKRQVWRVVLPYVVRNLPEPMMRTRFVRCWLWALPERAQHIGEMIYRGVEDHEWVAIAADVPEVIPRGLPGWSRRL